jgi:hypothetical protein
MYRHNVYLYLQIYLHIDIIRIVLLGVYMVFASHKKLSTAYRNMFDYMY